MFYVWNEEQRRLKTALYMASHCQYAACLLRVTTVNVHVCFCVISGCCFVTFYTRKAALDAQNALHNIKTMPGVCMQLVWVALMSKLLPVLFPCVCLTHNNYTKNNNNNNSNDRVMLNRYIKKAFLFIHLMCLFCQQNYM